ncbi:MAG: tRNA (adenosine(37)-N6)-threonylcarbamoyltransferase complex ATPase subunit type 1 TsaE [Trichloromonadaceae bacterium]
MHSWHATTDSAAATRALGRLLGGLLREPLLIRLCGDLGAGKTCLTQGLAEGLGVPAEEPVTSPSYTLLNQYQGRLPLNHFDLYRLQQEDDLIDLGFEETLDGPAITVIEWADRFAQVAGEGLLIRFGLPAADERRLHFQAVGTAAEGVLAAVARDWEGA